MRKVGEIEDAADAERLLFFLQSEGINVRILDDDGTHEIWIMDEDLLEDAEQHFQDFVKSPEDGKFNQPAGAPILKKIEELTKKSDAPADRHRHVDARSQIFYRNQAGSMTYTWAMIIVCVILFLMSLGDGFTPFIRNLYFSEYTGRGFPEIADGQLWRLVTPVFLHGNFLHIIFNMMWLQQLGGQIETLEKPKMLITQVLVLSVLCNTAQYMVSGPMFLGMSGVVYGMLGYIWMMGRFKSTAGYVMHNQIVVFMVVGLLICLVGIIPNVANTQHIVGLVAGTLWGFLRSGGLTQIRRRRDFRSRLKP